MADLRAVASLWTAWLLFFVLLEVVALLFGGLTFTRYIVRHVPWPVALVFWGWVFVHFGLRYAGWAWGPLWR